MDINRTQTSTLIFAPPFPYCRLYLFLPILSRLLPSLSIASDSHLFPSLSIFRFAAVDYSFKVLTPRRRSVAVARRTVVTTQAPTANRLPLADLQRIGTCPAIAAIRKSGVRIYFYV